MSIKRTTPTEHEYLKENRGLVAVLRYLDIPCQRAESTTACRHVTTEIKLYTHEMSMIWKAPNKDE